MKIISFDTLPSTNKYCELLDLDQYEEFTIVNAREQTMGVGQRGNHWESEPGKNLTFSIILKPTFLSASDQFQLTKALSLGIADWLKRIIPHNHIVRIKWPNDIYVDSLKICGTLTTCTLNRNHIATAVAGIGININQISFSDWIPNPTSLLLLTGRQFPTSTALKEVAATIASRYHQLKQDPTSPNQDYLAHLLHKDQWRQYSYQGQPIIAKILGVNNFGHLSLVCENGDSITCQMKELQWIW